MHANTSQALNLLHTLLAHFVWQVSEKATGKEAAQWVEPYPSLSGGTIAVWYRACCEQLQVGLGWLGRGGAGLCCRTPLPGLCMVGCRRVWWKAAGRLSKWQACHRQLAWHLHKHPGSPLLLPPSAGGLGGGGGCSCCRRRREAHPAAARPRCAGPAHTQDAGGGWAGGRRLGKLLPWLGTRLAWRAVVDSSSEPSSSKSQSHNLYCSLVLPAPQHGRRPAPPPSPRCSQW